MSINVKKMAGQKKFYRFGMLFVVLSAVGVQAPTVSAQVDNRGYESAKALKTIQWKWSDGVAGGGRTISNSKYQNSTKYPMIVVTIKPRTIPRIVSIEGYYENEGGGGGTWREENRAQSENGEVRIQPDPYCAESGECSGTFRYRILIEPSGDQPQYKRVEFKLSWRSSSSSGSSSSGGSSSGGSSSSSGSSSSGVSAAAFVGWNLEDVQDYLGFDPRTYDCSGSYRSVLWASNWWVVGYSGGTLIVSKSRSYCS